MSSPSSVCFPRSTAVIHSTTLIFIPLCWVIFFFTRNSLLWGLISHIQPPSKSYRNFSQGNESLLQNRGWLHNHHQGKAGQENLYKTSFCALRICSLLKKQNVESRNWENYDMQLRRKKKYRVNECWGEAFRVNRSTGGTPSCWWGQEPVDVNDYSIQNPVLAPICLQPNAKSMPYICKEEAVEEHPSSLAFHSWRRLQIKASTSTVCPKSFLCNSVIRVSYEQFPVISSHTTQDRSINWSGPSTATAAVFISSGIKTN